LLHQFSASKIAFISEQDGAYERRLKEAISVLLDLNATVARAYLARASYDGITGSIMLGLVTHDKKESGKLALQMDRAFGALFNTEAHLDVVFLDDDGDARIRRTCQPFYNYRARYH
jgi:SseB protein C-terminal domain